MAGGTLVIFKCLQRVFIDLPQVGGLVERRALTDQSPPLWRSLLTITRCRLLPLLRHFLPLPRLAAVEKIAQLLLTSSGSRATATTRHFRRWRPWPSAVETTGVFCLFVFYEMADVGEGLPLANVWTENVVWLKDVALLFSLELERVIDKCVNVSLVNELL